VIVDRSYADFSDDRALDRRVAGDDNGAPSGMLAGTTRAILVGTLSKAFGLAGLRIGYALGHPEVIAAIAHSRGPYKIGTLAERAATAALTQDAAWVRERVTRMRRNRDWFVRTLTETFGLAPLASHANFVLVPVPSAPELNTALRANGVATQPFVGLARIGDALRITIGRNRDLMTALVALRAVAINAPGLLPGVRERVLSAWPLGSVLPLPGEPDSEPTPTTEVTAVPASLEPTPVPPAPAPVNA
jgi:histidinol-phosphate/aromatic aminotransferase/cobyric acid decarboxylase-like protein